MEQSAEQKELRRLGKRLTQHFHKGCADYNLIEDEDKILIGLSGGKDSLALVELLCKRAKIYVPQFSVVAVHISVSNIGYKSDLEYLEQFCQEFNVPFYHRTTSYVEELGQQKNHCFLCSWYRRKALFDTARELGCNKIALGHHKDDILETLIMNLVFQGAFATIPPRLTMDKFPVTMIRPLCMIEERDLINYAQLRGYRKVDKLCPFEKESSRALVKQLLHQLEQLNPNVRDSMWGAMHNIKTDYLPNKFMLV